MMLWAALLALTALAGLLAAWPFLRPETRDGNDADAALELYRDQSRQLEREMADGTVSQADGAVLRREIERRVVALARAVEGRQMTVLSGRERIFAVAVVAGWVVMGGTFLYTVTGRPDLAQAPLPPRPDPVATLMPPSGSMLAPTPTPTPTPAPAQAPLADVDTMIAQLAARLEAAPDDLDGWKMLGWSYAGVGRFDQAALAYGRAAELAPQDADILALQAEALVRAGAGQVSDAARDLIGTSLSLDPANARARYLQGMTMVQDGDVKGAVDLWLDVLDASPADAPWRADLRDRIAERAPAAGIDLSDRPEFAQAAPASGAAAGPTAADIAAASQMSAGERQDMIRAMVDGLAERLEAAPDDPDGWLKLIRARVVLGEAEAAAAALAAARAALAARPAELARVAALARDLGLE